MKVEDAIKGIVTYRKLIHEENYWNNPERLSDVMAKLAVYNAYLADYIAPYHKQATDKAYKTFINVRNDGGAIGQADITSRGESTDKRELYENTLNIYRATDKLISVLQSRIKVAENQLKREGQL